MKPASLFQNGMLIEKNTHIWGTTRPGERVVISFLGCDYTGAADSQGNWRIAITADRYGGPFEMQINDHILRDVWVGLLWLCSGQSNMELPISRVRRKFAQELAQVNEPAIRAFTVEKRYDFTAPQPFCNGEWQPATPENLDQFFATSFFFAKSLWECYRIPIGLINCAAGGSTAEAWISEEGLAPFPTYTTLLNKWKNSDRVQQTEESEQRQIAAWWRELDHMDLGLRENWFHPYYDDSHWQTRPLTASWEKDLGPNGSVWFRKTVQIPPDMVKKDLTLYLGRVVDSSTVALNGELIGKVEYQYPPSIFKIPAGLVQSGENSIVVRVVSTNNPGGFVPGKLYAIASEEGDAIDLSGDWRYRIGHVMSPMPEATFFYKMPAGLYNAMLHPVLPASLSGVIWYQGESNTGYPADYQSLMTALIKEWRSKAGKDFPFLFTQLVNYDNGMFMQDGTGWPKLREQQLFCLSIPHTAMAVGIDCGEYNDLHPLDKKTIGERLALAARGLAYKEPIGYAAPVAQKAVVENGDVVIFFDFTGACRSAGLVARDGDLINCFELADEDGHFYPARAVVSDRVVVVSVDKNVRMKACESVRYAWADNPQGANLYSAEGLPVSPFRLAVGFDMLGANG